ncbi:hypothetical protein [Mesorhizobium sp. A556]
MADLSPIMTLFREFEAKYEQAADLSVEQDVANGLLDECNSLEKRMLAAPSTSARDFAAKVIVFTRYGDFALDCAGDGGVLDEALALLEVSERPDARLIELGKQFERVKAECRPLEREWKKLQRVFAKAREDAGLGEFDVFTPEIEKAWREISRETGYEPVRRAFMAKHSEAVRLMKAIHRTKATTLEGFAVKVAAVVFDQSDFEVCDPVPTDVAERELYRLARDIAKVVKKRGGTQCA